jgi:hypothetical protein
MKSRPFEIQLFLWTTLVIIDWIKLLKIISSIEMNILKILGIKPNTGTDIHFF